MNFIHIPAARGSSAPSHWLPFMAVRTDALPQSTCISPRTKCPGTWQHTSNIADLLVGSYSNKRGARRCRRITLNNLSTTMRMHFSMSESVPLPWTSTGTATMEGRGDHRSIGWDRRPITSHPLFILSASQKYGSPEACISPVLTRS